MSVRPVPPARTAFRYRAIAAGLMLLSPACGDARPEPGNGVTTVTDTIGGAPRITSIGEPPTWVLDPLVTLGTAGAAVPAADEFGRITSVIADAEGRIYVADAIATEIRVFDATGAFQRSIGRQGGGPGEFRSLQSAGWLGDTLAVLDPGNGRLGLHSAAGEWLGQRPYMALTGEPIRLYPTAVDELYMPMIRVDSAGSGLVLVRQTPAGTGDTLAIPSRDAAEGGVLCRHGRAISWWLSDLAPRWRWAPAPGGHVAEVWSAEYAIAFRDAAGDTARIIARDLPATPVGDSEWSREEADFDAFRERIADAECEPARPARPAAKERVRSTFFDDRGGLWVERSDGDAWALDAFDTDGRLVGTVALPERLERVPPYVRDGRLYLVVTDDLEVEYVRVFDIRHTPDARSVDGGTAPRP